MQNTNRDSSNVAPGAGFPHLLRMITSNLTAIPQVKNLDEHLIFAWCVFASFGSSETLGCNTCDGGKIGAFARRLGVSKRELITSLSYATGWAEKRVISFQYLPKTEDAVRNLRVVNGFTASISTAFRLSLGLAGIPPLVLALEMGAARDFSVMRNVYANDSEQLKYLASELALKLEKMPALLAVEALADKWYYDSPNRFAQKVLAFADQSRQRSAHKATQGVTQ